MSILKKLFFSCLLQLVVLSAYSQSVSLLVRSSSVHEQKIIDSIAIKKQHNSVPAALAEANALIDALQKKGYLESSYIKLNEANDTLFALRFELKSQTKLARIFCGKQSELFSNTACSRKGDTLIVTYNAIENAL